MNHAPTEWIKIVPISLPPPSLQDNTADADRLVAEIKSELKAESIRIQLPLLKQVPGLLRTAAFDIRSVLIRDRRHWHLVDITAMEEPRPVLGVAVDLGTTQITIRLIDLISKKPLAERSGFNPQCDIGPDILTRIHYSEKPGGLEKLNRLVVEELDHLIRLVCSDCGATSDRVVAMAVAGNTTMTHLLLGLQPGWIIREPYIPVINTPDTIPASEIGLSIHPFARIFVFPNVGSYFGGDLISGILFSNMDRSESTAVFVDVGTNAEVALGHSAWLVGCAGAAGPALEGDVTRMGMTAQPGAIDRVELAPGSNRFHCRTIGDRTPKGICGSGLIDLAACLFQSGMIDVRGKLVPSRCGHRYRRQGDGVSLVVVPGTESDTGEPLTIHQTDLDSLVRSKAAMYTILETVTSYVDIRFGDIATFYVAGAFGSFINPKSAVTIGMLPDLPLETYHSLGNSSLGGAAMLLIGDTGPEAILAVRDRITYMELNVNQEFMNRFSAARFFPHTDRSRFPSIIPQG